MAWLYLARDLPVDRYNDEEVEIVYYAIGLHFGQPDSRAKFAW